MIDVYPMGNIDRIRHHPELNPGCSFHKQYPDSPPPKHVDKTLTQGILGDNLGIDRIRSVAPDFQHDRIGCSDWVLSVQFRGTAASSPDDRTGAMAMKMIRSTSNTSIMGVTLIAA
jgi:hypothetical protein